MSGAARAQLTVIYDGSCAVCRRIVQRLHRLDTRGALELVPSQNPDVRARFPWIPEHSYDESLQVVRLSDGRTWQGAAAVEEVIRALRAGRYVSWVFRLPLARRLAERGYRWFADHRGDFACGDHCAAQTISPAETKNS